MKITRICNFCGKKEPHMPTCSRCRTMLYCSKECQKKDWPSHKLTCNKEQSTEATNTKRAAKILTKKASFIKAMSAICALHWSENRALVCSLKEEGPSRWFGLIESQEGKLPSSEDNYVFAIYALSETNITTHNCLCLSIPRQIGHSNLEIFGDHKPVLPIVLAIVDERIAISDEDNHRWIIS